MIGFQGKSIRGPAPGGLPVRQEAKGVAAGFHGSLEIVVNAVALASISRWGVSVRLYARRVITTVWSV